MPEGLVDGFALARREAFAALLVPNFRLFYSGQSLSLVGTWMQSVAQSWLVLTLTNSATAVGLVVAAQTVPILLLGPYGGVVADRANKRMLLVVLQTTMAVQALVLGVLVLTGAVRVWQVFALAGLLGAASAFENPTRQVFIMELVGPTRLRNAVSLNSVAVNVARAVGPALAGVIIAAGGTGICCCINAASFVAVIATLLALDPAELHATEPTIRSRGQLRAGLNYVRGTRTLLVPLSMMAIIGCLAYEFQVTLPLMAREVFAGGSRTYGFMTAAMGVGAVVGGLYSAARGSLGVRSLTRSAVLFGVPILGASLATNITVELLALALAGGTGVMLLARGNATLQLGSDPQMRGRVMALWTVAFLGSTPIGGPLAGWVGQHAGARAALALGALGCALAALLGVVMMSRDPQLRGDPGARRPA